MTHLRKDMSDVTVSVVMPAYNAERYIETAIRSVKAQTFTDWELIIIDDGSKDSSVEIIERLAEEDSRIKFFRNDENMGVAKTRNRGMKLSCGKYVAFLDSDDIWYPNKLDAQLTRMKEAGADISYSSYAIVNALGEQVKSDYIVPETINFNGLLCENVIGCSTVVLTAQIANKYCFDSKYYHEDYVLWLQLLREGYRACGNTEVLVDWRYIENSRSFDKRKGAKYRWFIYRHYLDLPFHKSAWVFCCYVSAGIRKYFGKR